MTFQKIALSYLIVIFSSLNIIAQSLEDRFENILDSVHRAHPKSVGIQVHVEAPDHSISWTSARGYSDKIEKSQLDKDQPVLIASNTKTYVSATILRLVENQKLGLDNPIEKLVSSKTKKILEQIGYNLEVITVRHLLSHTSGVVDYVDDDYFDFVDQNPNHQWKREDQIELASKVTKAFSNPGTEFRYADLNYLLLTEIIEGLTNAPFYTSMRNLIDYKKHGLNSTWFIQLEPQPKGSMPLSHQYWESKNWDSNDINPSWDLYGGGGLAASVKDLALFFQSLFECQIIEDQSLFAELTTPVLPVEQSNYCLGLRLLDFDGTEAYYHGGFWGTDAMYLPKYNTTIAISTLQKDKRSLNAAMSMVFLKELARLK